MKPRRDATRIICDILTICREGATRTQIVYRANLNSRLAGVYVAALARRHLLFDLSGSDQATVFATTEAGEELLAVLAEAEKRLGGSASSLLKEETEVPV